MHDEPQERLRGKLAVAERDSKNEGVSFFVCMGPKYFSSEAMYIVNFYCMQMHLVMSIWLIFGDD